MVVLAQRLAGCHAVSSQCLSTGPAMVPLFSHSERNRLTRKPTAVTYEVVAAGPGRWPTAAVGPGPAPAGAVRHRLGTGGTRGLRRSQPNDLSDRTGYEIRKFPDLALK